MSETFPDDVKYLARGKQKSPLLILGSSFHHWEFLLGFAVDKVTVGRLFLLYLVYRATHYTINVLINQLPYLSSEQPASYPNLSLHFWFVSECPLKRSDV
jgi:hypothetical protein